VNQGNYFHLKIIVFFSMMIDELTSLHIYINDLRIEFVYIRFFKEKIKDDLENQVIIIFCS